MAILDVKKTGATYSSIGDAYIAATDGDTIEVQDSEVYNEQLTIEKDNLIIQSATGFAPSLWYANLCITVDPAVTNFTIKGTPSNWFKLKASNATGEAIRHSLTTNITVEYVDFYDNSLQYCLVATSPSTGIITLTNNKYYCLAVLNGVYADVRLSKGSGTVVDLIKCNTIAGYIRQLNATITNKLSNVAGSTWGTGLEVSANYFNSTATTGIEFFTSFYTGILFQNNTIVNTAAGTKNVTAFKFSNFNAYNVLLNNIVTGFKYGINSINKTGAFGDYNDFHDNTTDFYGLAVANTHDILTDPLLENDYEIPAGSPCKNTGTNSVSFLYDILDNLRPQSTTIDIGCFERMVYGIEYAWQDTVQSIIIKFHDDMLMVSEEGTNDALNIDNYVFSGSTYDGYIITAEEYDTDKVKLYLSKRLDRIDYTILTDNLYNADSEGISPESVVVTGTYKDISPTVFERKYPRDIVGNKFDAETEEYDPESKITDPTGDLKLLSASETIKKIIHNICLTQLGSLVYTSTFGTDFELKGLVTTQKLIAIKKSVEDSIRKVNYVSDFSVNVVHNFDKVNVYIKVKTNLGTLNVELGGVVVT